MVRYWLAGAAALALTTSFAAAQSSSSASDTTITTTPGYTAPAPAQSYSETRQQRTFDANGVETTKTEHVDKSQTINNSDGSLSSETRVQTGESTTIQPPPPATVSTYRSQTTTTTDK
jgi:hypothetical protein